MSDKKNIFENDLLMRSILGSGQEEVPSRVWDAVSDRLGEIEGKKEHQPFTRWIKRAGIAVAAAAAVIATILIIDREDEAVNLVPAASDSDMIAVAPPEVAPRAATSHEVTDLLTYTPVASAPAASAPITSAPVASIPAADSQETVPATPIIAPEEAENIKTDEEADEVADKEADEVADKEADKEAEKEIEKEIEKEVKWVDVWEDEVPDRQVKTSFVLSGLTGATGPKSNTDPGPLKAPAVILSPNETGIKEKANQTKYGIPVSLGAGIRIEFTPRWSLGAGLNYTLLSRLLHGTYTHVNEAGSVDEMITSQIKNSQHYIGIPVNIYFNIIDSKNVNFYTYAGGTVEKCLSDKYHVFGNNVTHTEPVKGVQLSASLGLGAEFRLSNYLGLYVDPSLRYYFDCDQPKSIRTAQPLMLGAEIGLRFRL